MYRCLLAVAFAIAAVGCATTTQPLPQPPAPPVRAEIPIAVRCVDQVPARPVLEAPKEWAIIPANEAVRATALEVDWLRLQHHVDKLETILQGCAEAELPAAK